MQEWWRDPRCHFGSIADSSPLLTDRSDLHVAVRFIVQQLHLQEGDSVLDLCSGPGRYVIELSLRRLDVVGIDLNADYVELGRQLVEREGVSAHLEVADMREIPYTNRFDAVINVGTSFGFFESEAEDQRVIEGISGALKVDGRLLLEMGNRDYLLKNFAAASSKENSDGSITTVQRSFDYMKSRITTKFQRRLNGELLETWSHSWRAYTLAEVVRLFAQAKLELISVFGGWQSEPYSVDSRRMVVISGKRADS